MGLQTKKILYKIKKSIYRMGEKFANHFSERLVSKIHEEPFQLSSKNKKMSKGTE